MERTPDEKNLLFVVSEFERMNGKLMSPVLFRRVKEYYEKGLAADVIIRAFEKTAERSAHWEYTEGILKNLLAERIYTVGMWDKQIEIKRYFRELKGKYSNFRDEKQLFGFAIYLAFKEEYRQIEEKFTLYMSDPDFYHREMFPNCQNFDLESIRAEIKKNNNLLG